MLNDHSGMPLRCATNAALNYRPKALIEKGPSPRILQPSISRKVMVPVTDPTLPIPASTLRARFEKNSQTSTYC